MSTCASCKHWKDHWMSLQGERKVPEAQQPRWGTCQLIAMPGYGEEVEVEVKAFTQDGSDYAADLHTRDDFGCVLWVDG